MRRLVVLALGLLPLSCPEASVAATCTVTEARILVPNFGLEALLPALVGVVLPVELTPPNGGFRLDLSQAPVASTVFTGGVHVDLRLGADGYAGTIDASGNVRVPGVPFDFDVMVGDGSTVSARASLTTGVTTVRAQGADFPVAGTPLNFTSGELTLQGEDLVLDAPLAGGIPVASGLSVKCTLSPLPNRTDLPVGVSLRGGKVKARFSKPPKDGSLVGDTVSIARATFANVGDPIALATTDLFLRITTEGLADDFMLFRAPAGALVQKGKKYVVTDQDGSTLSLVKGKKRSGADGAPVSGRVSVTAAKGHFVIAAQITGVDLCKLGATSTLTLSFDGRAASVPVTIKPKGKSVCP